MATLSRPPQKRPKLEQDSSATPKLNAGRDIIEDENHCSICLQEIDDHTVIPNCSHEFCFECLLIWTKQSRRCPLCAQAIDDYLIHNIRSKYDFSKYYLAPLRTSPIPQRPRTSISDPVPSMRMTRRRGTARERARERREREELDEVDRLEQSIAKRRWIYRHHLYAKHVASNTFTRYKPYPPPAQFSASQGLISHTTSFVRRELQVWPNLDVEFLTTFTISIMKSIDIRSESAVKLLAEFLDMDTPYVEGRRHVNAEHFAHEIYSFVRSPFNDLFVYDDVVQYDVPSGVPPPPNVHRGRRRWRRSSRTSSRSRSCTLSSRSPSSVSSGHPCSRTNQDSRPSPHTRPRSRSRLRVSETDMHHSDSIPSSLRHETSKWRGRQRVLGSHSPHRDGNISDTIISGDTTLPRQTFKESEFIASSSRQRSDDNDVSPRLGQVSVQRGISLTKPRDVVIYGKGKRRADDARDETQLDNVQFIKTRRENATATQSGTTTHKPPRNRSLRESVEAHLGSGRRAIVAGSQNVNTRAKSRQSHEASSIPHNSDSDLLLFQSLTDSVSAATYSASQSKNRNPRNYQSGTNTAIELKDSTDSDGNSNVSLSAQISHQHSSTKDGAAQPNISVNSEIPEYSHASLEPSFMIYDPPQETVLPSQETFPCDKNQNTQVTQCGNNKSTVVIPIECHRRFDESDLRSRLREERGHTYAISDADTSEAMADKGQITGTESNNRAVDPHIAEERLRKRAHLRVKVAAEKREVLGGMTGRSIEKKNRSESHGMNDCAS